MRQSGRAVGRIRPRILDDVRDDLAVEIHREMRRRQLRLCDLRDRYGYSVRHVEAISRYLRGAAGEFGYESALGLAEKLGIRTIFLSGAEVGEYERFLAARASAPTGQVAA